MSLEESLALNRAARSRFSRALALRNVFVC
jgi:hypothetical protein